MSKKSVLNWILAGAYTVMAGSYAGTYVSQPQLTNIDLIANEAKQVQQYEGTAPWEALEQSLERIEIVKHDNPTFSEDITGLEQDINAYLDGVKGMSNPLVYNPILDAAADKMHEFSDDHKKSAFNLAAAITDFGLAGVFTVLAVIDRNREKKYQG
jgi:hypothetical protein